jgi:predicted flap endonuclease-1-like 5' DNA nuclease
MDLATLFIVALVIATLVGLTYVAFFKKVEVVPPPEEEVVPLELNPAEPRRPRTSLAEREQERAMRRARRDKRRSDAEAAAAAAAAAGVPGAVDVATPPADPTESPLPAAPATSATAAPNAPIESPVFASDANPSPEAIAAAPSPTTGPITHDDDLTRIKGLGPRAASQLAAMGITRFSQIADLGPEEAADVDMRMGAFQGRMARDRWIEQAGHLARGDLAGFEAKFGSLG